MFQFSDNPSDCTSEPPIEAHREGIIHQVSRIGLWRLFHLQTIVLRIQRANSVACLSVGQDKHFPATLNWLAAAVLRWGDVRFSDSSIFRTECESKSEACLIIEELSERIVGHSDDQSINRKPSAHLPTNEVSPP